MRMSSVYLFSPGFLGSFETAVLASSTSSSVSQPRSLSEKLGSPSRNVSTSPYRRNWLGRRDRS